MKLCDFFVPHNPKNPRHPRLKFPSLLNGTGQCLKDRFGGGEVDAGVGDAFSGSTTAVELVVLTSGKDDLLCAVFLNRGLRGLLGFFFFGYALPSECGLLEIKQ